ncbi:mannitol dehydrogenase family protein [Mycolicibacterium litorale]|uniref:Mannitol-1-phosphate 5-dehydrogenase n=1 Tax=Mycolicibacterium litorale TaxID=758802 RepID=A0AAD1MWY3_9MYCO|nr:mannitol dehydrogenase family protein [Mycolicibacterium litorale]MCV7417729.1 mannitol dehydrogenase family protein [Mycolicibacterium litorale]TDY06881.1 fructuronate reductase/mannitol 2-dehydrogenase [Mycolicibacterium litorale]BBY18961.1 mannitol 2-dehydrogenase [Mycolicibacterium litorale]
MHNVNRLRPNTGVPLRTATLALHSRRVTVPNYDRSALTPAVVHIGVGGFHRAHQASYLDDLARTGASMDWGITGVGLHRPEMKKALAAQDCLYTVVERGPGESNGRVVGSLRRYLYAPDEHAEVTTALADPRTRLVTLTITGDGYHRDALTDEFDADCPAVRHDLQGPGPYLTAWAYLADALALRRRSGLPPFSVMSCDNVPDNGGAARRALVGFTAQRNPPLARWIERNVAFPATMVDRITPKTTPAATAAVAETFGIADRWPVLAEPFRQWVVEDSFCNGRPPLEDVGVDIVADVSPYRLVKTRMLNGSHCALGYLGILLGHETTDVAMRDPRVYRFIEQLMASELSPLLEGVADIDLVDYRLTLLSRLTNPGVPDALSRLAARGSTKMPSYLLPSLRQARSRGLPTALLTLAVAAWFRYLRGYDLTGRPVIVEDERAQQFSTLARLGLSDPRPLLGVREVFGDLGDDPEFVGALECMMRVIDQRGVSAALQTVLAGRHGHRLQEGSDVAIPSSA